MALISIPFQPYPQQGNPFSTANPYNSTYANFQLAGATYRVGVVGQVPQAFSGKSIAKVGWRTGTVSITTSTMRVGVYTVSASQPTSTTYGGSAYTGGLTVASNTFYETTLGTAATCTVGDQVAVVWEWDAYAGTDSAYVAQFGSSGYPAAHRYNGTAWSQFGSLPPLYLKAADGTCYNWGLAHPGGVVATTINSTGTTTETGNQWTQPFKCRAVGIVADYGPASGTATIVPNLYVGGTLQASGPSLTANDIPSTSGSVLLFSSPVTIAAGAVVRATAQATSSANTSIYARTLGGGAGEEVCYGYPSGATQVSFTSSAWATNTNQLAQIGLLIDQIDDGTGAGGTGGGRQPKMITLGA